MEQLVMVVYELLSAAIVGLILLQQGKGADIGASFGSGASQTVFGAAGTGNLLTRSTSILATLFFLGSIGLAIMAKHKAEDVRSGGIPMPPAAESRDNAMAPVEAGSQGEQPAGSDAAATDEVPVAPASDVPAVQAGSGGEQAPAPAE